MLRGTVKGLQPDPKVKLASFPGKKVNVLHTLKLPVHMALLIKICLKINVAYSIAIVTNSERDLQSVFKYGSVFVWI